MVRDVIFCLSISCFLQEFKFVDINLISNDNFPLFSSFSMFCISDHIPDSYSMISFVIQKTAEYAASDL